MNTTIGCDTIASSRRQSSLAKVMAYSHRGLVHRLQDKAGMEADEAIALFDDTKRFLYLCGVFPGVLAPPPPIDECWHHFILFTEDYRDFCHEYFGRFVHHRPRQPDDPQADGGPITNTLEAAATVFGGTLSPNWLFRSNADECNDNCSPSTNCQGPAPPDCAKVG